MPETKDGGFILDDSTIVPPPPEPVKKPVKK